MGTSAGTQDSHSEHRSALLLAMLSSFLTPFMGSSVNVALPTIADEFSMTAVTMSWVITAYLLAAAAFLVPFGRLADIHGRKKMFLYGMWVFTIASILCAVAPSAGLLIAFRAFQGLGSAMMFGTSIAIISSVYPPHERGWALGLTVATVYVGLSAGPFFGGILTSLVSWRSLFVVTLPLCGAVLYAGYVKLKGEWAEARGERFDLVGSAIYSLSLIALVVGLSVLPATEGFVACLLGAAGIVAFVIWELRVDKPVLDMKLFRFNRAFAFSNLAALINYSATSAVVFFLSLYLQYVRGMDASTTGLVLIAQPVMMAAFSPVAGKLSDVVEPQVIASVGMAITAAGLVLLGLFTSGTDVFVIVGVLAFLGFGFALFSSPNTNAIMSSVEKKVYGVASATVSSMRLVGQVLSMGIATVFIAVYVGDVEITPSNSEQFMDSYELAFAAFAVLCFLGVFASLARGKVRRSV